MKQSYSLSSLPLRFQKLLSITVIAYIALYGVMLAIQQFMVRGIGMDLSLRVTDIINLLATVVTPVAMFIAGYGLVPNGTRWHRLTAGAVAAIAGQILAQPITQLAQLLTNLPIFASPYIYAGLSLGSAAVALGALLLVATRPQLWRRRSELLVWLAAGMMIVLTMMQLGYRTGVPRSVLDVLGEMAVPLIFVGLAVLAVYRAMRPLPKIERLFRAVLVIAMTVFAASVVMFIEVAIAQHLATRDVEAANQALVFLPYSYALIAGAVFVSGVWFARPKRTVRRPQAS